MFVLLVQLYGWSHRTPWVEVLRRGALRAENDMGLVEMCEDDGGERTREAVEVGCEQRGPVSAEGEAIGTNPNRRAKELADVACVNETMAWLCGGDRPGQVGEKLDRGGGVLGGGKMLQPVADEVGLVVRAGVALEER